jgi:hypothetical protein
MILGVAKFQRDFSYCAVKVNAAQMGSHLTFRDISGRTYLSYLQRPGEEPNQLI